MSRYRYEIDEANAIRVWDDENPNENDTPFFFQPEYPNGEAWEDAAAAEAWAELLIGSLEDPASELMPGDSPAEPSKVRPVAVEEDAE
jgi:hypothetical protein